LGSGGFTYLEILGLSMAVQGRSEAVKPVCQQRDTRRKVRNGSTGNVPASWKLSPVQQAFIDLFAEDEDKKQ
jgi:hypothetical protein